MLDIFHERMEEGKYSLEAVLVKNTEGVNVYLGGGEKSHIGTVVISQPRISLSGNGSISCTTSTFNLLGHKDDEAAVPLAEMLCKALNQVVVVTAGIHIHSASSEEIDLFKEKVLEMGKRLLGKCYP